MASSACPRCFTRLARDAAIAYVCTNPSCVIAGQVDEQASAHYGVPLYARPSGELPHPPPDKPVVFDWECPTCHVADFWREACPVCHYAFWDRDWRQAGVTTVALAGARSSGKSVYIAVLVQALTRFAADSLGSGLGFPRDADPGQEIPNTADRYEEHYQRRLFVERQKLAPTITEGENLHWRNPLVFSLGRIHGQRRYLAIRDTPGEGLEQAEPAPRWEFLSRADGVLFLFDSEREQSVRRFFEADTEFILANLHKLGLDPLDVLDRLLPLLDGGHPRLAVVLSKFDYVQAIKTVIHQSVLPDAMSNTGATYNREPWTGSICLQANGRYTGAYPWVDGDRYHPADPSDRDLLDAELRSLLVLLGAHNLLSRLRSERSDLVARLFAVSALGEPIRAESVSVRGITPFRVLDPILWLLDESWKA